jgi:hypothetical protein
MMISSKCNNNSKHQEDVVEITAIDSKTLQVVKINRDKAVVLSMLNHSIDLRIELEDKVEFKDRIIIWAVVVKTVRG